MQVLHPAQITAPLQARQLQGLVRQARQDWLSRYLPPTRGAACTLASLVYADGQVCAVNSGDARIWRLRPQADGSVQWLQLSRDHTAWQQMLDDGEADAGQADAYASIYQGLLRCLVLDADDPDEDGAAPDDWLHIWHGQGASGDAYLLATDGRHGALPEADAGSLAGRAFTTRGAACTAPRLPEGGGTGRRFDGLAAHRCLTKKHKIDSYPRLSVKRWSTKRLENHQRHNPSHPRG